MILSALVARHLKRDKTRLACAVAGMAASVALLSWYLCFAETSAAYSKTYATQIVAPFQAWITATRETALNTNASTKPERPKRGRRGMSAPALSSTAVEAVNKNGGTLITTTRVQLDARPNGSPLQGPPLTALVCAVSSDATSAPFSFARLSKDSPTDAFTTVAKSDAHGVCEALFCEALFSNRVPRPAIGSTMDIILAKGTLTLRVAGFFAGNAKLSDLPTLYVGSKAFAHIAELSASEIKEPNIALFDSIDDAKRVIVTASTENLRLTTLTDVADVIKEDSVANIEKSLPLSLSLTIATSIAMLLTVLLASASAQRRTLALMRCIGMTRGEIGRMVRLETLAILWRGWIAGILLGISTTYAYIALEKPFGEIVALHVGYKTIIGSLVIAAATGLIGGIVPQRQASRVLPLEALADKLPEFRKVSIRKTIAGIALIVPMVLLGAIDGIAPKMRTALLVLIAIPCTIASMAILVHPAMRLAELFAVKPLGWLLRLHPSLLSRRVSRAPGRAAGVVISIALGLGSFIAIHTWGSSLIVSYMPSREWPEAIVSLLNNGLKSDQSEAVIKELTTGENPAVTAVLPIEATQIALSADAKANLQSRGVDLPLGGVVLLFGTDPLATFGGKNPFFPVKFIAGTAEDAIKKMRTSNACIVPAMFTRLTGLGLGEHIELDSGISVEIVGVIDLNWHMVTSRGLVRTRFANRGAEQNRGQTFGMMFVSEGLARRVAGEPEDVRFLWCRMADRLLAMHPLAATLALDGAVRSAISNLENGESILRANSVQVHHREEIADGTIAHGNNILGTMARIPFWSLVITCGGIAAMIVASIRASNRETRVMRALGMTMSEARRLFFGEAMLTLLCALIFSLVGGILTGWSFTSITRATLNAGLSKEFVIPWIEICKGIALAIAITTIMVIPPLWRFTRDN